MNDVSTSGHGNRQSPVRLLVLTLPSYTPYPSQYPGEFLRGSPPFCGVVMSVTLVSGGSSLPYPSLHPVSPSDRSRLDPFRSLRRVRNRTDFPLPFLGEVGAKETCDKRTIPRDNPWVKSSDLRFPVFPGYPSTGFRFSSRLSHSCLNPSVSLWVQDSRYTKDRVLGGPSVRREGCDRTNRGHAFWSRRRGNDTETKQTRREDEIYITKSDLSTRIKKDTMY